MAAARGGDPAAWDVLFRRYQLPLFTYVMDLVRHEATSLDLVQETLVRAVRHLGSLRDDARFGSWLFGIAHQQVIQHWRRQGRTPWGDDPLPLDEPSPAEPPDLELARAEDSRILLAAVDALPKVQRAVILLHFLEEFSLEEIAAITEVPVGTVKSRLHYARAGLRQQLGNSLARS